MIPTNNEGLLADFQFNSIPTKTYQLHPEDELIFGSVDSLDAMRQAVYLVLNTERYLWVIYSWNYGVELADLFGKDPLYAIPEIERRIKEALLQDDRITSVNSFEFEVEQNKVKATFHVQTIFGDIEAEKAVRI